MLKRILRERREYKDLRSWLLNLYSRFLRRFPRVPIPGRGKYARVSVANTSVPVIARLGTSDIFVANEIFSHSEYDFVLKHFPSLKTIIDLGANVGVSMRYWREKFPSAFIVGVEPDRDNARLCHLNSHIPDARSGKTYVVRACAGGTARSVLLDRSLDSWAFRMGADVANPQTDAIPVLTFTDILARTHAPDKVDLLKCDIEGGEEELFRTCAPWIHRVQAMVVETHPPYSPQSLLDALTRNGAPFECLERSDKGGGLFVVLLRHTS